MGVPSTDKPHGSHGSNASNHNPGLKRPPEQSIDLSPLEQEPVSKRGRQDLTVMPTPAGPQFEADLFEITKVHAQQLQRAQTRNFALEEENRNLRESLQKALETKGVGDGKGSGEHNQLQLEDKEVCNNKGKPLKIWQLLCEDDEKLGSHKTPQISPEEEIRLQFISLKIAISSFTD